MKCVFFTWGLLAVVFLCILRVDSAAYIAVMQYEEDEETFIKRNSRDVYGGSAEGFVFESDEENMLSQQSDRPEVVKFHVQSSITGRYASTVITSKLFNGMDVSTEAEFPLTLPEEAFISDFFMIVDGTVYRSEVKEKQVAQRNYDKAKKTGQTAGQVKQKSPKASAFGISVNVAANSSVIFNVTYQQLLNRKNGIIEYKISSTPGQLLADYKVDVYITERQGINFLIAGWQQGLLQNNDMDFLSDDVTIERPSQYRGHIKFEPSIQTQIRTGGKENGFTGIVIVHYDVNHDLSAGELQVMNGYFVHYFSPEGLPPAPKSVVFLIDISDSMNSNGKLDYTKVALHTILDDMREGDLFNIVTFESRVVNWRETMTPVTAADIQAAKDYVDTLHTMDSTDLHQGMVSGVQALRAQSYNDANAFYDNYPMLIMLTDGKPAQGIRNLFDIRRLVKEEVRGEMSVFTLGFGDDVDDDFLEKLALENQGVYRKIYVDSSASLQLKGFYDEVATPLLYNIHVQYTDNAIDTNSITQTNFISYFKGSELVVAGKLKDEIHGDTLSATVLASSREESQLEMNVSANTLEPPTVLLNRHVVDDFAQRLWAYKTITLLLQKMKIAVNEEEMSDLRHRALQLSLKYHFVTPLTSLIVVKPEDQTEIPPEDKTKTEAPIATTSPDVTQAQSQGRQPKPTPVQNSKVSSSSRGGGRGGSGGRRGGGFADSDPHFVVHIPANELSICFDIGGNHGDIFNLLTDEDLGISVHGSIVSTDKPAPGQKSSRTYFGSITVHLNDHVVLLTPSHVTIDNLYTLSWEKITSITVHDFKISVQQKKRVEVDNGKGVNLVFVLHKVKDNHEFKVDHLGFYVDQGEGLSSSVDGLIGQFQYKSIPVLVPGSIQITNHLIVTAQLSVNNGQVKVLKKSRQNPMTKTHQPCWFARNNGEGLIEGHYTDYLT